MVILETASFDFSRVLQRVTDAIKNASHSVNGKRFYGFMRFSERWNAVVRLSLKAFGFANSSHIILSNRLRWNTNGNFGLR